MNDHQHAAFYPRLIVEQQEAMDEHGGLDTESFQKFIDQYLLDPSGMLVETEHF